MPNYIFNNFGSGSNKLHAENVIRDKFDNNFTAFIGRLFGENDNKLWLITYDSVVNAGNPRDTYSVAIFEIVKYVDVDIKVREEN